MSNLLYSPLVPPTILYKYNKNPKPFMEKVKAVLLLTDISGFTRYTEKLVSEKRENIENITRILNSHFEEIQKIIQEKKGFLLRYAGDSMLAMFGGEDAISRAEAAGWKIIDSMEPIRKKEGLQIKVLVGGGEFYEMVLGDEEKKEWAITGKAVSEIASAEKTAEAGSVMIKKDLLTQKFPEIEFLLDIKPEMIKEFYPAPLEKLPDTTFKGEYRITAPGFINVYGYNEENPPFEEIQRIFLAIKNEIKNFKGTINKIDIHPEGIKIMVVFGAPFATAEEYIKAIEFTRSILKYETFLKIKGAIGHGYVYAGFIGGEKKEYTIIGSPVNTTAKLLALAKEKELLVPYSLKKTTENIYLFERKGIFEIKEIKEKIEYFKLIKPVKKKETIITSSRKKLIERINQKISSQNKILILQGGQGTGKSFVVEEIRKSYPKNTLSIRIREGIAYEIFRNILEEQAGIDVKDDKNAIRKKLNNHFLLFSIPPELKRRIPFVGAVIFGLDYPGFSLENYPPSLIKENLKEAFRLYILSMVQEERLLLIIDDFHKADKESIALLNYILNLWETFEGKITLLITGISLEGLKNENIEIFYLEPLSKEEISQFASFYFGKKVSEEFVEFLWGRTQGNPSYLTHIIAHILRNNLYKEKEGKIYLSEKIEKEKVPETIYGLLMSRVDNLKKETKEIVKLGAVYGMSFPLSVMEKILSLQRVDERLSEAIKEGLLLKFSNGDIEYMFAESMTREAIYTSLLLEERKRIHEKIGKEVEKVYPNTERFYPFLAYHFYNAENWEKAFWYYYLAGKEDAKFYRNEQAIERLGKAIELWQEKLEDIKYKKELYECYRDRCMAYFYSGEIEKALKDASDAINISSRFDMRKEEVDALNRYTDLLLEKRDKRGLDYAQKALAKSKEIKYTKGAGDSLKFLGKYYFYIENNPEKSLEFFKKAEEEFLKEKELMKLLGIYIDIAVNMRKLAKPEEALRFFDKAKKLATQTGIKHLELLTFREIGLLYYDMGDFKNAEENLNKALNVAMEIGHRGEGTRMLIYIARIKMASNLLKEAEELLKKAKENLHFLKSLELEGTIEKEMGYLNFYAGKLEEALENFKKSGEIFEKMQEYNEFTDALLNISIIQIIKEEFENAFETSQKTIEIIQRINNPFIEAKALNILATIQMHYGDFEKAYESAKKSIEIRKRLNDPWGTAESLITLAEICWQIEKWEEGVRYADEIIELAEKQNPLMVCDGVCIKANILTDAGDYSEAENLFKKAFEIAEDSKSPEHLFKAKYGMARLLKEKEDTEKLLEILPLLYSYNQQLKNHNFSFQVNLLSAYINLKQGNPSSAQDVLKTPETWNRKKLHFINYLEGILLYTGILVETGMFKEAENYLEKIKKILVDKNFFHKLILLLLLERKKRVREIEKLPKLIKFFKKRVLSSRINKLNKEIHNAFVKKCEELLTFKKFYEEKWRGAILLNNF